jgi:hypothetical protein
MRLHLLEDPGQHARHFMKRMNDGDLEGRGGLAGGATAVVARAATAAVVHVDVERMTAAAGVFRQLHVLLPL